jgi:hypothetical protein
MECEIIELLVTVAICYLLFAICYLRSSSDSHSDPTSDQNPIAQVISHFAVNPTCHLSLVVIYKAAVYYKAALQQIPIEVTNYIYIKNNTTLFFDERSTFLI